MTAMAVRFRFVCTFLLQVLLLSATLVVFDNSAAQAAVPTIRVSGNKLVDGAGNAVRLVGVNRSGSEYACQQGGGIFVGPTDQASIDLMKSWKMNAVRVPLNEHCWLGISWAPNTSGQNYRNAIIDYVNRLTANGLYVILDLHFTGPNGAPAIQDAVMANRQYSVPFWQSVAQTFKTNPALMFELFNEPRDIDWNCWLNGCQNWQNFQSAGMQELVNAVRAQGASQPIIISGLDWGHDMRQLLQYKPNDPAGQLAAGQHLYNFKRCADTTCWNAEFAPVAAQMPLVGTEIGENDCSANFVTNFMKWMDANGGDGYTLWHFGTGECPPGNYYGGSALLADWNGTPTAYGSGVKTYFASLGSVTPPPPPPPPPPPVCPTGQFSAEYFNNRTLSGVAAINRCETSINNSWGSGGPGAGVGVDNFSARWTATSSFAAGTYNFSVTADDGVRLYIDDALAIDAWKDQAAATYVAQRALTAGNHVVKVEYYENGGDAVAKASWSAVSAPPPPPTCPAGQYSAQYFNNRTLSGAAAINRCEAAINNDWGSGGPGAGVGVDNFSAIWTGSQSFTGGTYNFSVSADDGVRMYIDNTLIIDAWKDQAAATYTSQRSISAGNHNVKVEYYENGGQAVAKASWVKL